MTSTGFPTTTGHRSSPRRRPTRRPAGRSACTSSGMRPPAPEHSYEIARDTPLTDDYLVCKGEEEVRALLKKVWDLPKADGGHGHGQCRCH